MLTPQTSHVHPSISSLLARPSLGKRRVGVCIDSFEACSDFTRSTAQKRPLPRGFNPLGCPTEPLVSFQTIDELSAVHDLAACIAKWGARY
jgi:hypothetical protein